MRSEGEKSGIYRKGRELVRGLSLSGGIWITEEKLACTQLGVANISEGVRVGETQSRKSRHSRL